MSTENQKNNDVVFTQAGKLNFDPRPQMSRIFVDAFFLWINHYCKDKEKLSAAFEHTFLLQHFFVAVSSENGNKTVSAMAACTNGYAPVKLDRAVFIKHLGAVRGWLTYFKMKSNITNHGYPFALSSRTGSIEYVATAPNFRNQGLAGGLLEHVLAHSNSYYDAHVLEVADTNDVARRLYARLGFKEFERRRAVNRRRTGVGYFLYMRRVSEEQAK